MATRSWGMETLANTIAGGLRTQARVAALSDGGFAVVWFQSDAGATAIRAQAFSALGFAISGEITVAEGAIGAPVDAPTVAGLADVAASMSPGWRPTAPSRARPSPARWRWAAPPSPPARPSAATSPPPPRAPAPWWPGSRAATSGCACWTRPATAPPPS